MDFGGGASVAQMVVYVTPEADVQIAEMEVITA